MSNNNNESRSNSFLGMIADICVFLTIMWKAVVSYIKSLYNYYMDLFFGWLGQKSVDIQIYIHYTLIDIKNWFIENGSHIVVGLISLLALYIIMRLVSEKLEKIKFEKNKNLSKKEFANFINN